MSNPKDNKKAAYVVAPRRSVTVGGVILEPGDGVDETKVNIQTLLKKKAVVKR